MEQLREAARGDREEDVLQHRRLASGHLVQREGLRGRAEEARELRRADGRQSLYGKAGPSLGRVVPASSQGFLELRECKMSHLIDRRENARGKSAVNRARFMRRYKAQIGTAVKKMVSERRLAD